MFLLADSDHYRTLQVDPAAEPEIIEAAYRRLARKYHPDVSSDAGAEARMKRINAAYEVLRDPVRRSSYDLGRLKERTSRPSASTRPPPRPGPVPESPRTPTWPAQCHPLSPAYAHCMTCERRLCLACSDRFHPPTCTGCLAAWARHQLFELIPLVVAFGLLWLLVTGLTLWLGAPLLIAVGIGYLVASVPSGYRILAPLRQDHPAEPAFQLMVAVSLGIFASPFVIGKAVIDVQRTRRLLEQTRRAGDSG